MARDGRYGHAAETLVECALCPPWEPRWANVINDEGLRVCVPHAMSTCEDLVAVSSKPC